MSQIFVLKTSAGELRGTYRICDSQPFIALRLPQLPGPGLVHHPFPETHRGVAAPASWH